MSETKHQARAAMLPLFLVAAVMLVAPVVALAQMKGAALLIPSATVANLQTNKQRMLYWDSSEPQFNIYSGSNRASLTKRATINSNSYAISQSVVYGVSAVNMAGIESVLAYWPSNRVGKLVWQTSSNMTAWTDGGTLESFTNTPKTQQMYLRIVDRTTQWLPPN